MKGNELMIGDWVRPIGCNPFRIGSVLGEMVCNDSDTQTWCEDEIEPVPLTPEILEKNGFEKSEYGWYCNRKIDAWEIEIYIGRIETFVKINKVVYLHQLEPIRVEYPHINNTDCHFVHQLQHALRLCGIDKEITIEYL